MKLRNLLSALLAASALSTAAMAADTQTGLSAKDAAGTTQTLCAFTSTSGATQLLNCAGLYAKDTNGVWQPVGPSAPVPVTVTVPAGATVVSGSASTTSTTPTTIIPAVSSQKAHITSGQCWNSSTTQNTVTFNDTATTSLLVPPGGTVPLLLQPGTYLIGATNTALQMTQGTPAQTTIACNLQGYNQQ